MKGGMINQFKVGDAVRFTTTIRTDFSDEGKNTGSSFDESGRIVKLIASGRNGSAKIKRENGTTVTRRLQHVRKYSIRGE